ncbi:ubiquitin-conjugating enzyme [Aspergillus sp. HF37]|nr:ubiquitin-conjugating enzyme [Aspergillus sp. HF37]
MSSSNLPNLPSLRRHQLFQEFLQYAAPPGVYVTITPGDPTLWSGVLFVRSGPYASAVLRFQIRFPPAYPDLPPLVTFFTDVFHPLIVPLTTYTFSTNASSDDPISASDEERLSPGGFSLRHGFPRWFGRSKKSGTNSAASSRTVSQNESAAAARETSMETAESSSNNATQPPSHSTSQHQVEGVAEDGDKERISSVPSVDQFAESKETVPVSVLLDYIRSTFDDEAVLDSLPLEAAGNPGAWHAWRSHRQGGSTSALRSGLKKESPQARLPGDWHWDGIWAKRVRTEIEASHSDQILFGNPARGGTDDTIRFFRLDEPTLSSIKEMMIPQIDETHE